jgi:hypothetical protein
LCVEPLRRFDDRRHDRSGEGVQPVGAVQAKTTDATVDGDDDLTV